MISEDIKNCKHWKYETTDDPHFADVHVNLHNVVSLRFFRKIFLETGNACLYGYHCTLNLLCHTLGKYNKENVSGSTMRNDE